MPEGSLTANLEGTDSDLLEGMIQVFLQLAPERLQRLAAAAGRADSEKLVEEAQKIASAAQRIAAAGVSDCTREISTAAVSGDYDRVREQLGLLSDQIALLQAVVAAGRGRGILRVRPTGSWPLVSGLRRDSWFSEL